MSYFPRPWNLGDNLSNDDQVLLFQLSAQIYFYHVVDRRRQWKGAAHYHHYDYWEDLFKETSAQLRDRHTR